jgi:CBS domain-containing protein
MLLVRVVEPVMLGTLSTGNAVVDELATQSAIDEATAYLHDQAESLQKAGYIVQSHVRRGNPWNEILSTLHESAVDLVVMTTHGRMGIDRWRLGSVADHVVRHANRPVLLVSARALAARVAGPYKVADLMTRDPVVLRTHEALVVVARKLLRWRISGAPVVSDNGQLVGFISEKDLVSWHAKMIESLSSDDARLDPAEYGRRFKNESAGAAMSHPAVSIDADAPLMAVVDVFRHRRLRRLPVTRDGKLIGMISRSDVLRAMLQSVLSDHEPVMAESLYGRTERSGPLEVEILP